ncbi:hypothetical protein BCON_0012g00230 [Botryotinia convoluta]|uniref:Uncharacterized protein n=1 Tax=Botryotinia convoluta TaxID=54673 RepID=A0A4Z1J339_9HELO|nr:hypothetical protein BCON_0012g00230 [Botryotinia convoluta]
MYDELVGWIDIDSIDKLIVRCFETGRVGRESKGLIPDSLVQHGVAITPSPRENVRAWWDL